jgi:hypothetical protein
MRVVEAFRARDGKWFLWEHGAWKHVGYAQFSILLVSSSCAASK